MRVLKSFGSWLFSFSNSIRFRLTLWFILILALVLGVFSTFIYITQSRDLQFDAVQEMQDKLGRLDAYFHSPAWQNSDLSPADIPSSGNDAPLQPGDLIILATTDGQVLQNWGAKPAAAGSLTGTLVSAVNQNHDSSVFQQSISVVTESGQGQSTSYLFYVVPVLRHDILLGFMILGSPSPLPDQLRRLAATLLLGSLGMLVVAFAGGLWLADRAMRPVKTITYAARTISESDLTHRLNLKGRDELAQLAGTFDEMLSRLQTAFDRQRRFVADASHELRTPLTITNLEVGRALSGHRTPDEYRRALQVVDSENTRMTRLVNDLMALARMDSGQAILQWEDLDLSDVAVEANERMLALAERRQVSLDIGDMPELPVRGDRQYLIQMISNLIENGIKYGQPGQKVRIETGYSSEGGQRQMAWLRVSDNGQGIPPEHLSHLFDRFYRVDQSRTQAADEDAASPTGTGLGLSIVAWIVQVHGGQIHVDSKLNEGTTFEVTIPLIQK